MNKTTAYIMRMVDGPGTPDPQAARAAEICNYKVFGIVAKAETWGALRRPIKSANVRLRGTRETLPQSPDSLSKNLKSLAAGKAIAAEIGDVDG
jgi:hypothetical protein